MDADFSLAGKDFQGRSKWAPWLIVLTGVLAFANSVGNPYVFDDARIVQLCSRLSSLWPLSPRIVADLTFWLNGVLCGPHPACYRAVNIAIHLMAGLLLYGIIRRTLLLPRFHGQAPRTATWLAAATAVLWVVHPLQTESVIYVCQRYESLMGMFYLLSLYSFLRGCTSVGHQRGWYDGALAACILGMGTKGTMVTAPLMILLYDQVLLSGSQFGTARSRWKIHAVLLTTACITPLLLLLYREHSMATYMDASSILAYGLTQFRVVAHYIRLVVCPYPLCLDYGWGTVHSLREVVVPAVVVLALMAATGWTLWRRRAPGYLGAWFFVILAPTSSIIVIDDVIFEHRMYLPLAGPIVLAVAGIFQWVDVRLVQAEDRRIWSRTSTAVAGILIALCMLLTALRNLDYRSERILWGDVIRTHPDNLRARNDLAVALCEAGEVDAARVHFAYVLDHTAAVPDMACVDVGSRRLALPNNSPRHNRFRAFANMGLTAFNGGRLDEAISCYVRALRLIPGSSDVLGKLRQALRAKGVAADAVDEDIRKALRP